jgi:hypothetical protein
MQTLENNVRGSARHHALPARALPERPSAAIIPCGVRGKKARLGTALVCVATAGPGLLALAACDRQVLRLLPDRGPDASMPPHDGPDARAGCERNSQCDWPLPYCNVPTRRCVGCIDFHDCDAPEECDSVAMRCALPCTRENDCRSNQSNRCNESRGFCVECIYDADCNSQYPHYCDPSGRCTDCEGAANCR